MIEVKDKKVEPVDKTISRFLKASNDIEQYLHSDGPLTPLQHQTIVTTILGLQTLMQSWMRKHRPEEEIPQPNWSKPRRQRNPDGDGRSPANSTLDADMAAKRAYSFLHARQP